MINENIIQLYNGNSKALQTCNDIEKY